MELTDAQKAIRAQMNRNILSLQELQKNLEAAPRSAQQSPEGRMALHVAEALIVLSDATFAALRVAVGDSARIDADGNPA